jgi:hypothetical protein
MGSAIICEVWSEHNSEGCEIDEQYADEPAAVTLTEVPYGVLSSRCTYESDSQY